MAAPITAPATTSSGVLNLSSFISFFLRESSRSSRLRVKIPRPCPGKHTAPAFSPPTANAKNSVADAPHSLSFAAAKACDTLCPLMYSNLNASLISPRSAAENPPRRKPTTFNPNTSLRSAPSVNGGTSLENALSPWIIAPRPTRTNWWNTLPPPHENPVADLHVAAQQDVVGEHHVVPHLRVVPQVRPGHQQTPRAQPRDRPRLRAPVDRAMLADLRSLAHLDAAFGRRVEREILRPAADHRPVPHPHAAPQPHRARQRGVGFQHAVPSPISAGPSTTAYGPIRTPAPTCAAGSTTAVG